MSGLELCYLGRLTANGDAAFVYASERFLARNSWPSDVWYCAKDAVSVLSLCEVVFPDEGARLAIFYGENLGVQITVVVGNDLIAWGPTDTPGKEFCIWKEREHADAMLELIRQVSE